MMLVTMRLEDLDPLLEVANRRLKVRGRRQRRRHPNCLVRRLWTCPRHVPDVPRSGPPLQPCLVRASSMPDTIACVSVPGPSACPPPWSAPIVGSSMMSTVLCGSICIESQEQDATSVTNMRGGRITCAPTPW